MALDSFKWLYRISDGFLRFWMALDGLRRLRLRFTLAPTIEMISDHHATMFDDLYSSLVSWVCCSPKSLNMNIQPPEIFETLKILGRSTNIRFQKGFLVTLRSKGMKPSAWLLADPIRPFPPSSHDDWHYCRPSRPSRLL